MARANGELPQPAGCILASSIEGVLPDAADHFGLTMTWKVHDLGFKGWPGVSVDICFQALLVCLVRPSCSSVGLTSILM